MSKIVTVFGGTGFIGRRIIKKLLEQTPNIKIYSISNNPGYHHLDQDKRTEYLKGNALQPEQFKDILEKSDAIVHSIGKLLTNNQEYMKINYETCIRIAEVANNNNYHNNDNLKKIFVYISAERGLSFPLNIPFSGYIESKRKAEKELISRFKNIKPIILRPGMVYDAKERASLFPLYSMSNVINCAEKTFLDKILPNKGEKLGLPPAGIELEALASFAAAGALGKLKYTVYSNDYMNKIENLIKI